MLSSSRMWGSIFVFGLYLMIIKNIKTSLKGGFNNCAGTRTSATNIFQLKNFTAPPRRRRACGLRFPKICPPSTYFYPHKIKTLPERKLFYFVRVPGIEPESDPWQGPILPLNYTRN